MTEGDAASAAALRDSRRARIYRGVGIAVSLACVAALASGIDASTLYAVLRRAHAFPLCMAAAVLFGSYAVQARRFQRILALAVPFGLSFRVLMMSYFANSVLPLRAGDVLRAVLARRALGGDGGTAVTSVVVDRIFDVVGLVSYGLLVLACVKLPVELRASLWVAFGCAGVAVAALFAAGRLESRVLPRLQDLVARSHWRLARAFFAGLVRALHAAAFVADLRRFTVALALTWVQWGLVAASMGACFASLELELPWYAAVFFTVATNLGTALPSAPASIGVFHGVGVIALAAFHIDKEPALAAAIVTHALMTGMQWALGALSMAGTGGSELRRLSARR